MRVRSTETEDILEEFINSFYASHTRTPSLREMESGTGISRQTAQRYLKAMSESGRVRYDGRNGIITGYISSLAAQRVARLPILGRVICGDPSRQEEQTEGYMEFPLSLLGSGEYFVLLAYGDSMTDAGIEDGEAVIVRRQSEANPGDIVVAIDDEGQTTLKRLAHDGQRFYLHPENAAYGDIYPRELRIQGKAVKVLKDLEGNKISGAV